MQERATILFILNPLIYPEISPLFGRLVLVDCKKAVSKLFTGGVGRSFFIFDEINVYASTALIDLVNKSRSANVTCILATQSLSDLASAEDENFKEQVIENCNNYIVMRQNSAVNSEAWANILGTAETMEMTYQMRAEGGATVDTGLGSAKLVREFIYHPDSIKSLKTGQAFFLSRDTNKHCKVQINKPF
jgi:type IV secretory pathway TraG/TraD family ATPase VirD4